MIAHPNMLSALSITTLLATTLLAQPDDLQDVLRGPSVPDRRAQTLVQHTMSGELMLVEGRPEMAAVQLIDLDQQQLEAARQALRDRSTALTMHLVDRIDLLRDMTDAQLKEQDAQRARQLFDQLWNEFEPGSPRDPLLPALSQVLPDQAITDIRLLLDEYWAAWIDASLAQRGGADLQGDHLLQARTEIERDLRTQLFREELAQAYDVSIRRYQEVLQGIYDAIEPTEEQRQAIRGVVIDHIRNTRLEPTIEQRRQTMRDIYELLDEQRRSLLFDHVMRLLLPDR